MEKTPALSNFHINQASANDSTAHQQPAVLGQGGWSRLQSNLTVINSRCCRELQPVRSCLALLLAKFKRVDAHISYFIAQFCLRLRKDLLSKQSTHCLRSRSLHWATWDFNHILQMSFADSYASWTRIWKYIQLCSHCVQK